VFEIGSNLREARMRQKLELADVERATRIRARYLMALEEERFDIFPGTAYAKGFLRTYADHLGLDAQRFVDEYNSRFAQEEAATELASCTRPDGRHTHVDPAIGVLLSGRGRAFAMRSRRTTALSGQAP
jgi:cytoskeletal protein RodZ